MTRPVLQERFAPPSAPWYAEEAGFFGANFFEEYADRMGPSSTMAQVRLVEKYASPLGRRLLDVGCGNGRHLERLAALGFCSTGIDLNAGMIRPIPARTGNRGRRKWQLAIADMRLLPFRAAFDTAISMYSSFGYFPEPENLIALIEIRRALAPGGRVVLDVLNREFVRDRMVGEEHVELAGGGTRTHRRRLDAETARLWHERVCRGPEGETSRSFTDVRLYDPAELTAIATQAGFRRVAVLGGYDGERPGRSEPRLIYVGEVED